MAETIESIANNIVVEQKEGLKLTKNSKGYTWEIKLTTLNIDELERINKEMLKRFSIE